MTMAARLLLLPAAIASSSPKSPPDPATVAAGARLYDQYCATCHGRSGAGERSPGNWLTYTGTFISL